MIRSSGKWLASASAVALLLSACSGAASPTVPASAEASAAASPAAASAEASAAASPAAASGATSCPAASGPIKIGIPVNWTGSEALAGQNYGHAVEMAIDQKNAAGGIGGQKVIYQEFDNASPVTGLPDQAVTASTARQMVADSSIYAVVGGANSSQTKIDLPLFASDGLVMLSGSSTNPDLTDPSMPQYRMPDGSLLFFRTVPNDKVLGPATAKYVHDDLGVNTVFFVDDGLAYGVGVGDQVEKTQAATGIKLIGRDRIDPQSADYSTLMTKINGLNPDGVMMVAGSGPGGKFAHQAKGVLTAKVLFGGDGIPDPGFIEQASGASDGWIGVLGGPDITKLPAAQQFLKDFAAKYNSQPRSQDADYYEASTAALKAIESVVCAGQPLTRAAVRNALKTVSFDGVTGPVSFDVNGDRVVTTMSVWKDEGGVPVFVRTLSAGQ